MKKLLAYLLMVATCYGVGYQVKLSDLNNAEWVEVALGDYRILWSDIGGVTPPAGVTPVLEWLRGSDTVLTNTADTGTALDGEGISLTANQGTNGMFVGDTWWSGFNNRNQYARTTNLLDAGIATNCTIEFMIKQNSMDDALLNYALCFNTLPPDASDELDLSLGGTYTTGGYRMYGIGFFDDFDNTFDLMTESNIWTEALYEDKWVHITIRADFANGIESMVFINGVPQVMATTNIFAKNISNKDTLLWGRRREGTLSAKGEYARLRIYEGLLENSLIATNANNGLNSAGIISDYLADTPTAQTKTKAVIMCNNIYQDGWTNSVEVDTASAPDLKGTTAIGWGEGDGLANYLYIAETNFTTHIFWAGPNENELTNYATIDGTQYVNGSEQAYANVYYYTELTTNYFWKSDASTFYDGIITAIHLGDYDASDVSDFYTKTQVKYE